MAKLSGGEALVKSLVREGVEVVFGLPGVQMYGIVAALRRGKNAAKRRHVTLGSRMASGAHVHKKQIYCTDRRSECASPQCYGHCNDRDLKAIVFVTPVPS